MESARNGAWPVSLLSLDRANEGSPWEHSGSYPVEAATIFGDRSRHLPKHSAQ